MASDKDRLEDIRQWLEGNGQGEEEQLDGLLQDGDAMDDVRVSAYLRQALNRRYADEMMPADEVGKELSRFKARMASKQMADAAPQVFDEETSSPSVRLSKPLYARPLFWTLIGVAACLLLLFGATWWFRANQPAENPDIAYDVPRSKLTVPSIVTSTGKVIPLTGQSQNLSMAGGNLSARNRLLRALGFDADEVTTEKCSIAVPPGKSYDIVLPDGTKVWLYADSKLTYPLTFSGKERAVYLQGQAEFDVTHDASHPFVVITDKLDARVLGTEINVSCYPDEAAHVALLRGIVAVSVNKSDQSVTLRPGQGVTLQGNGSLAVAEENMDTYEYWKNGYLYFDDQPLTTIAKNLERWYRVPFVIDNPSLAQKRLRFFCLRSESIDRALELLNHFSGIEAKRSGDAVHIK